MTGTVSRVGVQVAPCGRLRAGEHFVTEDRQGLVTDELRFSCGCRVTREEFHDGSVHRMVVQHTGRVLVDEELRGE
jgi:hypothetical protein